MSRPSSRTRRASRRHGVASVLAMMFLVIFGSLAAAMAVVATGNIRTADVSLRDACDRDRTFAPTAAAVIRSVVVGKGGGS